MKFELKRVNEMSVNEWSDGVQGENEWNEGCVNCRNCESNELWKAMECNSINSFQWI